MAGSTPIYGLPYPEPSDLVANYPALGEDLAETLDEKLPSYQATAPASPSVGQVWIDSDDNLGRVWTGSVWQLFSGAAALRASDVSGTTGSPTITTAGGYTVYQFTGTGSITLAKAGTVEVLALGGGGSGGGYNGGGGGAGGYTAVPILLPIGAQTVTVGAGGASTTNTYGLPGNSSGIGSIAACYVAATGGGPGGLSGAHGMAGGSGGGGGGWGAASNGGSGFALQGNNGGASNTGTFGGTSNVGGGGGGTNAVGNAGGSLGNGNGGAGLASSITGSSVTRGGGGGGGCNGGTPGAGGAGGGGAGSFNTAATAGTVNTGGGGGGGGWNGSAAMASGAGGSGIVIIRVLA